VINKDTYVCAVSWFTDPSWIQFEALPSERPDPLGCHRRRISDRIVCGKLLQLQTKRPSVWPGQGRATLSPQGQSR
jgi:hypothetical protein